jgi:hypothetical protein
MIYFVIRKTGSLSLFRDNHPHRFSPQYSIIKIILQTFSPFQNKRWRTCMHVPMMKHEAERCIRGLFTKLSKIEPDIEMRRVLNKTLETQGTLC